MAFFKGKQVVNFVRSCAFNKNDHSVQNFIKRNFHCTARCLGSIIPFNLSDIGEGIKEVAIKEWYVKEGDRVCQFDNICEVQSDKASVNITSRYDGIIKKIHYDIDQIALVGKPLIDIEVEDEESTPPKESQQKLETKGSHEKLEENIASTTEDEYSLCIPSVRRLARQYKVDLKNIKGTGKNSRILKEDILKYLKTTDSIDSNKLAINNADSEMNEEIVKIKGFQKAMFLTMTASLQIPHFVYTEEIKVTNLSKLRKNLNSSADLDTKLSFMPFFIKAISLALLKYPILNSRLDIEKDSVIIKKNHNIGVAMDTKVGLAVPVIRNVQNIGISKIAEELKRLMSNGKNGNFSVDDLKDGTFSFSNIGVIGGVHASPVILSPQVAILAVGATKLVPRYDENMQIIPEEILNMCGAADHRIIDGATMANFVNLVKKYIENPNLLMLMSN